MSFVLNFNLTCGLEYLFVVFYLSICCLSFFYGFDWMFDAFFLFHKIHVDLTVTKSILVALFLYSFTIKYGLCLYKYSCGSKGRVQGSDCTNMCSACNSRHCNWINTCVKCSLVPCNGIRLYQNWQLDRILIYNKPYHWKAIKHMSCSIMSMFPYAVL